MAVEFLVAKDALPNGKVAVGIKGLNPSGLINSEHDSEIEAQAYISGVEAGLHYASKILSELTFVKG
jgi:hypothetical protein